MSKPITHEPKVEAYALMALDAAIYGEPHPPWVYGLTTVPLHERIGLYIDGLPTDDAEE